MENNNVKEEIIYSFDNLALHSYLWDKVENPKGVILVIHGMQEHAKRYDNFAKHMNNSGFIVFASDLRGHGKTAKSIDELGYSEGDIFQEIIYDQKIILQNLKKRYDNLPIYVLGHSFGSFLTQRLMQVDNTAKKFILIGSAYTKTADFRFGKIVANITKCFKGKKAKARLIEMASFKQYGKKFEFGNWLTTDLDEAVKYKSDKFCGKSFPVNFYKSMFTHALKNYAELDNIENGTKILILAGDNDPVGKNGKLIKKLYETYIKHNIDAKMKLYPKERHEILNGVLREVVYNDIIEFLNRK